MRSCLEIRAVNIPSFGMHRHITIAATDKPLKNMLVSGGIISKVDIPMIIKKRRQQKECKKIRGSVESRIILFVLI